MPLKVVTYPEPVLMRPARRIKPDDGQDLAQLFEQMLDTMHVEGGIGLAAPQVDLGIRFIVARDTEHQRDYAMVNPQITWSSKETEIGNEGCLSFPMLYGDIERAQSINVRYQDLEFKQYEERFSGYFARVLQHEIDHLNGVLIVDRAINGLQEWTPDSTEEEAHEEAPAGVETSELSSRPVEES